MARLSEVPWDELDLTQPAAEGRHALGPTGQGCRLRGAVEGGGENRGAGRRRLHGSVRVQADEQIGLVVVGDGRAFVDWHVAVIVSRENDADTQAPFDCRLHAPGDTEHQVLFFRARSAFDSFLFTAVAWIDRDRSNWRRR